MDSRLLKLPGEIRNRVYELVAANDEPVKIKHCYRKQTVVVDGASASNDDGTVLFLVEDSQSVGTYAGLTRVCRQIRKEYLPLHRGDHRVSMDYADLHEFLDTFFDEENPIKEIQIQPGSIRHPHMPVVDILPIIRARQRFPEQFSSASVLLVEPFANDSDDEEDIDYALVKKWLVEFDSFRRLDELLHRLAKPHWEGPHESAKMFAMTPCPLKSILFGSAGNEPRADIRIVVTQQFLDTDLTNQQKVQDFTRKFAGYCRLSNFSAEGAAAPNYNHIVASDYIAVEGAALRPRPSAQPSHNMYSPPTLFGVW